MDGENRSTIYFQLEQLHSKYQGTGHINTKRSEWGDNILRDTASSNIMHQSRISYFAIAENTSKARISFRMLESMIPASLKKREQ
ncbi:hypothetical protein CPHLJ_4g890 [Cryptosporidium parvum]|uniref:Splicing factor subunit n=1 Tax=Cryptosporidium parvum TaxID=5807 RepID=A0A7S7RFX8_CRYPV|nr:Splicing factor 3B subunit 5/RDS3 complex subunit 10 [Cryptosporidium parvum]WKS77283.1 hypothetical protein CPCDC_4g890 [Cryptosporidium sp. 43IA8]WRK32048.1 Splicing factor 3B subunit 5/RDS3 complex subunit 10 [Cryptosporidium parvum]|eukprot:QOY41980.1 hypothetical protein CPATCC_001573 [Cryptosporidium parvum]